MPEALSEEEVKQLPDHEKNRWGTLRGVPIYPSMLLPKGKFTLDGVTYDSYLTAFRAEGKKFE